MFDLPQSCRVLIQGIDQPIALVAISSMLSQGTNVVAGVNAGQGGQHSGEIPIFDLVEQAQNELGLMDVSIIFNSPWQVMDAAMESIAAGIERIIICSGGVPPLDSLEILRHSAEVLVLGSGSAGVIAPDRLMLGSFDPKCFQPGKVGIISRSKSLACEAAGLLRRHQMGQSVVVHVGSDSILGSTGSEWLKILSQDASTEAILLLGDIDRDEELLAIARSIEQQVVAYRPQLTSSIAPLSDAAMLLRAGRRSLKSATDSLLLPKATLRERRSSAPVAGAKGDRFSDTLGEKFSGANIMVAESLFAIPALLKVDLSEVDLSPTSKGEESPNGFTDQVFHG
jgi:succinyl-CoA synthetase alpha subunit